MTTIVFRDGSTAPVEQQHWSPAFVTALATRADGFKRCVFIGRDGVHSDPWILRLQDDRPQLSVVA